MTISQRVNDYLDQQQINYELVPHEHSHSSLGSAIAAHLPLNQIAKAVLLKDHEDRRLVAILPANNKISLSALNDELNASFRLAKEQEVYNLFKDCDHGAVPPIAQAYGLTMVYDKRLENLPHIYLEAGDHENLIHLDQDAFKQLFNDNKHFVFSHEVLH